MRGAMMHATHLPSSLPSRHDSPWLGALALAVAALSTLACACVDSRNEGRFEVDDIQAHRDCLGRAFPFEPTYFSARERIDSVGVFMQSESRLGTDADFVHLEVYATERARNSDSPVDVAFPSREGSEARADLEIQETCPRANVSLAIEGTAQFDEFRVGRRGRVVGRLTEGAVVDARTGEEVAGSVTGEWAFDVHGDGSWPTYDDRYPVDP